MIRFADKKMLPHLVALWQQSFGDSAEYIQMFLDWNFEKIKTIVYMADDRPVSVAYLLPTTYVEEGKSDMPCWYLYAAATLSEYRGRGYFAEILRFVDENMSEPIILVPGEESLISYYEKRGLHVWLKERKEMVSAKCTEKTEQMCEKKNAKYDFSNVSDISVAEYVQIRDHLLMDSVSKNQGYMQWDEHFMKYICHENQYCGGKIKQVSIGEKQFIAMYRVENKQLKVLELLPQSQIEECVQRLLDFENYRIAMDEKANAEVVNLKKAICECAEVVLQPAVMANLKYDIANEEGYFNLIMG